MTADEAAAKIDRELNEVFATQMAELEAMLIDHGASEQELAHNLAHQHALFEAQRKKMIAMVKRVVLHGGDAATEH